MTAIVSFFEFVDFERLQLAPASKTNARKTMVVLRMIGFDRFVSMGRRDATSYPKRSEKDAKFWCAPAERCGDGALFGVPRLRGIDWLHGSAA